MLVHHRDTEAQRILEVGFVWGFVAKVKEHEFYSAFPCSMTSALVDSRERL
jgi:hypothetical protein